MGWFFSRKPKHTDQVFAVYTAIVAQSRQDIFFSEWSVPDTVTGRFDVMSLHIVLVLRRLRSKEEDVRAFSQALFDIFFKDMDRSLREMGVSDVAIPKRIEKMGELLYGLLEVLTIALDEKPEDVEDILVKNVFSAEPQTGAKHLASYVRLQDKYLSTLPLAPILDGELSWEKFGEQVPV